MVKLSEFKSYKTKGKFESIPNTACIGMVFRNDNIGEYYVLCQIAPGEVIMAGVSMGNRYADSVAVANVSSISKEEMLEITDDDLDEFEYLGKEVKDITVGK